MVSVAHKAGFTWLLLLCLGVIVSSLAKKSGTGGIVFVPYRPRGVSELRSEHGGAKRSAKLDPDSISKVERLGKTFRNHVRRLRNGSHGAELVFLVDSSASVGAKNFYNELKFVRKLLSDFTVSFSNTRVAVVTFSSPERVKVQVDHISRPSNRHHKCSLLGEELPNIEYSGGGTYTLGALLKAQVSRGFLSPSTRTHIIVHCPLGNAHSLFDVNIVHIFHLSACIHFWISVKY